MSVLQPTTSQQGNTGFNFHAAMQNQPSIFNSSLVGSATQNALNVTSSSSSLFNAGTGFPGGTNQVDNSGMEISHPVGEMQQSTNLNTQPQGFQLPFGSNNAGNQTQPFVFGAQNQTQNMFSTNVPTQTNIFGGGNTPSLVGNAAATGGTPGIFAGGSQQSVIFTANPAITNRPIKKAKRRTSGR